MINGNSTIDDVDGGMWYYNATETSWADGLANNNTLLLGTPAGRVEAGGIISATIPRHGIAIWRLKEVNMNKRKRDEL